MANLIKKGVLSLDVSYSLNMYDEDGECYDKCVLLHINNNTILRLENVSDLNTLISKLLIAKEQIKEELVSK